MTNRDKFYRQRCSDPELLPIYFRITPPPHTHTHRTAGFTTAFISVTETISVTLLAWAVFMVDILRDDSIHSKWSNIWTLTCDINSIDTN